MSLSNRIERLALDGFRPVRIARMVALPCAEVEAILDRSPLFREVMLEKAEARRRRDDARRRLLQSDIGRAPSYLFLASKRDALGHVDWDSVRNHVDWREEIEQILSDSALTTKVTAGTPPSAVRPF